MSTLAYTLVSLCVSLTLVGGLPAARRLPLSSDRDDVLAGSDFLSMFIRRRAADRPGPFEPHHYDREINSVSHKSVLLDLVKAYPDKYAITNIFKPSKYGYENEMSNEGDNYPASSIDPQSTHETEVVTTTQFTESTTTEEIPLTENICSDNTESNISVENQYTTVNDNENSALQLEPTTQKYGIEKFEEKIISVRVSTSVARHSHRTVETSTTNKVSEVTPHTEHLHDNFVSRLVTQEQPTIHAVQRSEFTVDEAPIVHSETNNQQKLEEVQGKVQEVTRYGNEQRGENRKLPVFEIHYHNPPAALLSNYNDKPNIQSREGDLSQPLRKKDFRQLSSYGRQEPVAYHSRVSSATSDSSVNFYREYSRNHAAAETVQQPTLLEPYPPAAYRLDEEQPTSSPNMQNKETSTYHEEPSERAYGEPEKVYGQQEQNYEVDEAVSVLTNGKAHGIQESTPPATDQAAQNKFGYVVEGRNFRKYRVEERTNDGFIVGEYGVVSHDDGSLRGVRYTADSTINPRLIYDTLVKFLSL